MSDSKKLEEFLSRIIDNKERYLNNTDEVNFYDNKYVKNIMNYAKKTETIIDNPIDAFLDEYEGNLVENVLETIKNIFPKTVTFLNDLFTVGAFKDGLETYFDVMGTHFSNVEQAFKDELNTIQKDKLEGIISNLQNSYNTGINKADVTFKSLDEIDSFYDNQESIMEDNHKTQRESLEELIEDEQTKLKDAFDEKVQIAVDEYDVKKAYIEEMYANEELFADEILSLKYSSKEEALKVVQEEYDDKVSKAQEEYQNGKDLLDLKLKYLIETQELEKNELIKAKAVAIETFNDIGVAFGTEQGSMRAEIIKTNGNISHQISLLKNLREESIKKARAKIQFELDMAKAKSGGNPNYEAQRGDLADKGTENTLINSGPKTKTNKPKPKYNGGSNVGDFNQYHNGGIFRSRNGSHEGLALLRNNELILTPEQQQNLLLGNSGGLTNNFNIANMNIREESDIDKLAMRLNKLQKIRARQV